MRFFVRHPTWLPPALWALIVLLTASVSSAHLIYTDQGAFTAAIDASYDGHEIIDFNDYEEPTLVDVDPGAPVRLYAAFSNGHQIGPVTFTSLTLGADVDLRRTGDAAQVGIPTGLLGTFLVDAVTDGQRKFVRPGGQGPEDTPRDDDDFELVFDPPVPAAGLLILDNLTEANPPTGEFVRFELVGGTTVDVALPGGSSGSGSNGFVGLLAENPGEFVERIVVEEDLTLNDDIGFDDIVYGLLTDTPRIVGQVGTREVTGDVQSVSFAKALHNPLVFVSPVSSEDSEIALVRVTEVTDTGFTVKVHEQPGSDGVHAAETLHWLAIEAGAWVQDGFLLEAGSVTQFTGVTAHLRAPWTIYEVAWTSPFSQLPLMLSQVQSENFPDWVGLRQWSGAGDGVGTWSFAMDAREASFHPGAETVAWLLVDRSAPFVAELAGFTDAWSTAMHSAKPVDDPRLLAQVSSLTDVEHVHLRYRNLDATMVDLRLEEDTVRDPETTHPTPPGDPEDVVLVIFEGGGYVFAAP
ncbi:MAG: hypothetical protein AAGC60_16325 [Acidobacteriota bacterium]